MPAFQGILTVWFLFDQLWLSDVHVNGLPESVRTVRQTVFERKQYFVLLFELSPILYSSLTKVKINRFDAVRCPRWFHWIPATHITTFLCRYWTAFGKRVLDGEWPGLLSIVIVIHHKSSHSSWQWIGYFLKGPTVEWAHWPSVESFRDFRELVHTQMHHSTENSWKCLQLRIKVWVFHRWLRNGKNTDGYAYLWDRTWNGNRNLLVRVLDYFKSVR